MVGGRKGGGRVGVRFERGPVGCEVGWGVPGAGVGEEDGGGL